MQLVILDSDVNYLKAISLVASSQMKENFEILTYSNKKDLLNNYHLLNLDSYILIHESFMDQLNNDKSVIKLFMKRCIGIISEGIIDLEPINQFLQIVVTKYNDEDIYKYIHMKHQRVDHLLENLKDHYLKQSSFKLHSRLNQTKFVSIYSPYGSIEFSSLLEANLKKIPSHKKILLIHYDPFYHNKKQGKFNLSYLFTLLKRGKDNLSLIIREISQSLSYNIDSLSGPLNMLDIDCLSKKELMLYTSYLANLDYDYIVFNFNGIHLTKHINYILEESKDAILLSDNEDVQLSVIRQCDITWTMMTSSLNSILKEVVV